MRRNSQNVKLFKLIWKSMEIFYAIMNIIKKSLERCVFLTLISEKSFTIFSSRQMEKKTYLIVVCVPLSPLCLQYLANCVLKMDVVVYIRLEIYYCKVSFSRLEMTTAFK